ncbi:MAG TPA: hypothetical protein VIM88_02995 [Sulfurovum sp.]|uniref:hypothetical protein n=1 Tax=Sulfurovum sp. TaxID=1969726 RepID=UPI002F9526FA
MDNTKRKYLKGLYILMGMQLAWIIITVLSYQLIILDKYTSWVDLAFYSSIFTVLNGFATIAYGLYLYFYVFRDRLSKNNMIVAKKVLDPLAEFAAKMIKILVRAFNVSESVGKYTLIVSGSFVVLFPPIVSLMYESYFAFFLLIIFYGYVTIYRNIFIEAVKSRLSDHVKVRLKDVEWI